MEHSPSKAHDQTFALSSQLRDKRSSACFFFAALLLSLFGVSSQAQVAHWVAGYFPAWELGDGTNSNPPLHVVDFSSMTVVAYFGFIPSPDGAIDTSDNINYKGSSALIMAAHAVGTKVTMSIGGWNTGARFEEATSPGNLNAFVSNIVGIVKRHGYDGVDLDWEPLNSADYAQFTNLAKALRAALPSPYLLTIATGAGTEKLMASVCGYFDEINLMTYDLMGAWQGWVSWYNSALYDNGITVAWSKPVPSCNNILEGFINAGVPPSKLGIGAEFSGTIWKGGVMTNGNGVTGPDEKWITPPSVQFDVPLYWHDGSGIMQKYYSTANHHWDSGAQASYLSIDSVGTANDMFISYDDSASIVAKVNYIKNKNIGGLILYELGWGYPGNGTYPLLKAIKEAFGYGSQPPGPVLDQNYPNPFSAKTTINYRLVAGCFVILRVYDSLGTEVATLVHSYQNAGRHSVQFNGKNLPGGVYKYTLKIPAGEVSEKMVLLK